jgi:hypothetical protein
MSRPGAAAGRSASPVTTSQAPAAANASVITHRSAAPTAARALTVPATVLNERGCSVAAIVQPATSSSGAASAETTPSQGTPGPSCPPAVSGTGAAVSPGAAELTILIRSPHPLLHGEYLIHHGTAGLPMAGTNGLAPQPNVPGKPPEQPCPANCMTERSGTFVPSRGELGLCWPFADPAKMST